MQCRWSWVFAIAVVLVVASGCSVCRWCCRGHEGRGQAVALSDVPSPAREAIGNLVAGGEIKKIGKEMKDGVAVYDVEARVAAGNVEYDVDAKGNVLTSEEEVSYESLPAAARAAAEKYFGSAQGLKAGKEVEKSQTFYEVVGQKGAAKRELKLTAAGDISEDEEADE
jgi:hypothetical protein